MRAFILTIFLTYNLGAFQNAGATEDTLAAPPEYGEAGAEFMPERHLSLCLKGDPDECSLALSGQQPHADFVKRFKRICAKGPVRCWEFKMKNESDYDREHEKRRAEVGDEFFMSWKSPSDPLMFRGITAKVVKKIKKPKKKKRPTQK